MDADKRTTLPDAALAVGMAMLAGATDVFGLARLDRLFVSFMSGNTTLLGVALGHGGWARSETIAILVGLFVAGAAAGAMLGILGGRRHAALVIAAVACALAVPLAWPRWTIAIYVVAMGALNAAMTRIGEAAISLTYVTGTLVKLGQGIGHALCGRPGGWGWLWHAVMWLSLLAGAVVGTLAQACLGKDVLWPLPAFAALLAVGALAHRQN